MVFDILLHKAVKQKILPIRIDNLFSFLHYIYFLIFLFISIKSLNIFFSKYKILILNLEKVNVE